MKALVAVALLAMCSGLAIAQSGTSTDDTLDYMLAEIVWGESFESAQVKLIAAGWKASNTYLDDAPQTAPCFLCFERTAFGAESIASLRSCVCKYGKDKTVAKTTVAWPVTQTTYRSLFNQLLEVLTDKYGPPQRNDEVYVDPYYRGDGYELQAISLGKGAKAALWPTSSQGTNMILAIVEGEKLELHYESKAWQDYVEREDQRALTDF